MKKTGVITGMALLVMMMSNCGNNDQPAQAAPEPVIEENSSSETTEIDTPEQSEEATDPNKVLIDLEDKGVGVITSVELASTIDQDLASRGGAIFDTKCSVCHKPDQNFLGPKPQGILERRSPEWVMNMILNPQLMLEKNDIAKALLKQYNGVMMPPTGLTEEEARAVLEYYRTIK